MCRRSFSRMNNYCIYYNIIIRKLKCKIIFQIYNIFINNNIFSTHWMDKMQLKQLQNPRKLFSLIIISSLFYFIVLMVTNSSYKHAKFTLLLPGKNSRKHNTCHYRQCSGLSIGIYEFRSTFWAFKTIVDQSAKVMLWTLSMFPGITADFEVPGHGTSSTLILLYLFLFSRNLTIL